MYRIRSQKMASRYSDPDRALSKINTIRPSVQSAYGKVDLHDSSRGSAYRARMVNLFSQTTAESASDRLVDSA